MLLCCYKNVLRSYSFVVLIITLIFHIFEIVSLGKDLHEIKWIVGILLCHIVVVCSTVASFRGVLQKEEKPLLIYLLFAAFGFIPILIDMVRVFENEKILMFDTSFIESDYGSNAMKPILCLILLLAIVVKIDFTTVVYQYYKELKNISCTLAESAPLNYRTV